MLGDVVFFEVKVEGMLMFIVKWFNEEGEEILKIGCIFFLFSGKLVFSFVILDDEGIYKCVVVNESGEVLC